jgi:hypothetical protein
MLCRRCRALKLQKSGGRFTTSSKVPVPSDHKSPDHKSPDHKSPASDVPQASPRRASSLTVLGWASLAQENRQE